MDGSAAEPAQEPGPFGRPWFDDPDARALQRVGVIDVGSNSVRLVVFDGAARSPAFYFNEKVLCGLGRGMTETSRLHPEGRERAMSALKRFALLARGMKLSNITAVATAAVREAEDGPQFCAEVEQRTGLHLWVIDGLQEACFSAQGVLLGWPDAEGLVCDIGGSSMELAEVGHNRVDRRLTTPLGPFRLQDVPGGKKGLVAHIDNVLDAARAEIGTQHDRLYLVGGSWRALARIDMVRRAYPLPVLHEYEMNPKSVRKTLDWMKELTPKSLKQATQISSGRAALAPLAAVVLRQLLRAFKPKSIHVSAYGLREGLLYDQMSERLRARDPLIEACWFAETTHARMPGLGRRLYRFIQPLYASASPNKLRLVKAACLLHDVNWRAHPDFRAEACFDTATRANLGALDHMGRVFLGLALMHRYRNGRLEQPGIERLYALLSAEECREAEVLGKAMRFGAMLSISAPDEAGKLKYFPRKHRLELVLTQDTRDLFGEVAQSRLSSLAKSLGAEYHIRIGRLPAKG